MIQLHIITNKIKQVKEIAKMLIDENLITDVTVLDSLTAYDVENGSEQTKPNFLLMGRTKAMLFTSIEKLLEAKYGVDVPVIYGMPIVNMDLNHLEKLKKTVKEV